MTIDQTLAAGKTERERFAGLGYVGEKEAVSPRHMFGLLAGKPDSGKSSLLMSCPSALVINTDLLSCPVDDPKAIMWPWIKGSGEAVDESGQPFKLTWKKVLAKRDQFFKMMDAGQEVPDLVALDSIAGTISLVKEWVIEKSNRDHWKDLDGRRAWDDLYEEIITFAQSFRRRGKGFFYTCHVVDEKIPLGDDRYAMRPELTITSSFWKRLFWQFELVAVMAAEWKDEEYVDTLPGPVVCGKQMPGQRITRTRRIKRHLITTDREELAGITKCKRALSDVAIPLKDGWAAFEAAYMSDE